MFAKGTTVSSDQSRREIEALLARYGATKFGTGWDEKTAVVTCVVQDRHLRFKLPIPRADDPAFEKTTRGCTRPPAARAEQAKAEERRRWRALVLVLKAKLEAVESGICSFESEFLAHIVVPNGETFGEYAIPQIAAAYASGKVPKLLGGGL